MNKRWVFRRHEEPDWVGRGSRSYPLGLGEGRLVDSFALAAAAVFGHAKQGASCRDIEAAGKQVLTNGPSTLAGAISPTAVSERWLGCGAERAPFRRRRSTDDRPALATARTAGGADPCFRDSTHDTCGHRRLPRRCPVLLGGASAPARLAPSMGTPGPWCAVPARWMIRRRRVDQCRTRRNRLDRLRLQPCRHGPADPVPD